MTKLHHSPSGGFINPWPDSAPAGFASLFRWWRDRLRDPPPVEPTGPMPEVVPHSFDRPRAAADRVTLTWVGHSTFLVQIGSLNVLTDPMWSERASPLPWVGPRRRVAPGIPFADLPAIDAILVSHDHYDHLDDLTVCRLEAREPGARWLVPLGVGEFLRRRGVREITELDWWQETQLGSLTIGCVPAQHFSGRTPWSRNATLWCGWSIAVPGPGRRLFFAGDTGYHPEFADVGRRYGPFDACLLPIGAYEPRWFMRPVHMTPEEAVQAFVDLQGLPAPGAERRPVMVPMHWGTFRLTDEPLDEPPARAAAAWQAAGLPADGYWLLAPGESRTL